MVAHLVVICRKESPFSLNECFWLDVLSIRMS